MNKPKNQSFLCQIEKISSAAKKWSFNFENLIKIKDDIEKISEFLGISNDQTILFCCLV